MPDISHCRLLEFPSRLFPEASLPTNHNHLSVPLTHTCQVSSKDSVFMFLERAEPAFVGRALETSVPGWVGPSPILFGCVIWVHLVVLDT